MKIAIISTFVGQKTSGGEISAFLLAHNLKEKQDIFIVTAKITKKMPCRSYAIPFLRFIPNMVLLIGCWFIDFFIEKKMHSIFKKENPDIVHIQDASLMIAALKAAKKL